MNQIRYWIELAKSLHEDVANSQITSTPGFQQWFAGSKLVDGNGKPLVLYHGTSKDQDFKKFRVPANGAWFTTNPVDASSYAQENDSMDYKYDHSIGNYRRVNTASRVIPVYIRAINPAYVNELPEFVRMAGSNGRGGDPTVAYRRAQKQWFDELRAEGHDAVVIGGDTVVVLGSPSQIKSAIGNKNFNPKKTNFHEDISIDNLQ